MDASHVVTAAIKYYKERFGLDIEEYVPAPVPALRLQRPDPMALHQEVILPTRNAVKQFDQIWQSLHHTNYSLANCAHAVVELIFNRSGVGRQLLGLDCMEITHAVLAGLHGEEYLLNDRVDPVVTSRLMRALPSLWNAVALVYPVIADSVVGESFVAGVYFNRWQGQDMVVLVETFNPVAGYSEHAVDPVI